METAIKAEWFVLRKAVARKGYGRMLKKGRKRRIKKSSKKESSDKELSEEELSDKKLSNEELSDEESNNKVIGYGTWVVS